MVKALSKTEHAVIASAIKAAEERTHAQIAVVVSPASDTYQSYILLDGLVLGSAFSLLLWVMDILANFPLLLLAQIATMAIISFIPPLRRLCIRSVPKHALRHRAAHRAFEEYMIVSRHASKETPVVLFYISLAERYAHILPSHAAQEKVSHETWEKVVEEFTRAMKQAPLQQACLQAIDNIAKELSLQFKKI